MPNHIISFNAFIVITTNSKKRGEKLTKLILSQEVNVVQPLGVPQEYLPDAEQAHRCSGHK
jgi:hypothetical protein